MPYLTVKTQDKRTIAELQEALSISNALAALLYNRGIQTPDQAKLFLHGTYQDLPSGKLMLGVEPALKLILEALAQKQGILVFGDYDVDGISATTLVVDMLKKLGGQVEYYIPHRVEEGYGLSCEGIDYALEKGCALIITVDCGSTAYAEILYAQSKGLKLIVTDHHSLLHQAPPSGALIINPKQAGCPYPYKDLSGAGVAFKLMQTIADELKVPELAYSYLDLVALGTVADVVPLLEENRILVKTGLAQMQKEMRPALAALLQQAGIAAKELTPKDLAFLIAPRLNAAGRLETAELAVNLLLEEDPDRILEKAKILEDINSRRQQVEEQIRSEALALAQEETGNFLLLAKEGWHPGVIGITAARLAELYNKPVLLACLDQDIAKGSARSFCGANIFSLLEQCQKLLLSFGGHSKAGGFKLKVSDLPAFRQALTTQLKDLTFFEDSFEAEAEITLEELNLKLYYELEQLQPFGEANPEPDFLSRGVRWETIEKVGAQAQHLRGKVAQGKDKIKILAFNQAEEAETLEENTLYDIAYSLQREVWQDKVEVYLKLKAWHKISPLPEPSQGLQIIDRRGTIEKVRYLESLLPQAESALVLVRLLPQAKKLQAKISATLPLEIITGNSSLKNDSKFYISCFHLLPVNFKADEVFLLYPPPHPEHFQHILYEHCRRIHLLFGSEELAWEESLREQIFPDQEKLRKIYIQLKEALYPAPLSKNELEQRMTSAAAQRNWHKTTLEVALRIFQELNLIKELEEEKIFLNEHPVKLNDSKTYRSLLEQKEAFASLKEILHYEGNLEFLFAK
jgi:single-stranded-DNA-specific exonuclease